MGLAANIHNNEIMKDVYDQKTAEVKELLAEALVSGLPPRVEQRLKAATPVQMNRWIHLIAEAAMVNTFCKMLSVPPTKYPRSPLLEAIRHLARVKFGTGDGYAQGIAQGKAFVLQRILGSKFGPLPAWATNRLKNATAPQVVVDRPVPRRNDP